VEKTDVNYSRIYPGACRSRFRHTSRTETTQVQSRRTTLADTQGHAYCTLLPLGRLTPAGKTGCAVKHRAAFSQGSTLPCFRRSSPFNVCGLFIRQSQRSTRFLSQYSTSVPDLKGERRFLSRIYPGVSTPHFL